jgi:hypothetical protein
LTERPEQVFTAVRIMLGDIFNAFGRAEIPHVAADRTLRLKYFRDAAVAEWAHRQAVATSQEMVEE